MKTLPVFTGKNQYCEIFHTNSVMYRFNITHTKMAIIVLKDSQKKCSQIHVKALIIENTILIRKSKVGETTIVWHYRNVVTKPYMVL